MKRYWIKRTLWYQAELNYEEDGRAKECLKKLEEAFQDEEKSFGVIIEKIYDSGVVPDLFKVILKPYQPTLLHAMWNAFWSRRYRIDMTQIVKVMKNTEIAVVVSDFFLLNTSWIGGLGNSSDKSAGSLKLPRWLRSPFLAMRSSTS
jgi:hypothetical protein